VVVLGQRSRREPHGLVDAATPRPGLFLFPFCLWVRTIRLLMIRGGAAGESMTLPDFSSFLSLV